MSTSKHVPHIVRQNSPPAERDLLYADDASNAYVSAGSGPPFASGETRPPPHLQACNSGAEGEPRDNNTADGYTKREAGAPDVAGELANPPFVERAAGEPIGFGEM
eukprot:TRINITY_DN85_c0_g1_i1.p3 TRINITY_DN85_c0_g1~~TRINITY_DN85_c0_g1_i1.p3  ORF type:complete len:121 (+),score=31.15 TRINITY_DN85_c0_g1_i1:46-363(+)